MAEVKHTEYFDCTPEQFFDLLVDYEKYPEFLSEVKSCKVVGEDGGKKLVEFQVSVVKSIKYLNKHTEVKPNEVSWVFQSGDLFKSMSGGWKLQEDNGKTKAEYYVDASFGLWVPQKIIQTVLSVNLPAMMKSYHQRVAQLYK